MPFPFYKQYDSMDCGPACLRMVAAHFGKSISLQELRERCYIDREGVSLLGISEAAESVGLRTLAVKIPFTGNGYCPSLSVAPLPVILHWNQKHFVVAYRISRRWVWIADPATGKVKVPIVNFKKHWISDEDKGIALLVELSPEFNKNEVETAAGGGGKNFRICFAPMSGLTGSLFFRCCLECFLVQSSN